MKLSLPQEIALGRLARPGEHTCTSIGSAITQRQSAYGWQTSAREGGRTLHALRRRGLAQVDFVRASHGKGRWIWSLTSNGRSEVMSRRLAGKMGSNPR
jgi:hypothetical protein